jgi:probable HAF family extracellular repeat protein
MNLSSKSSWLLALMILAPFAIIAGMIVPVDLGPVRGSSSQATPANRIQLPIAPCSSRSGDTNTYAFSHLFKTKRTTDLGALPRGLNSYALAVNMKRVVAGCSDVSEGITHAVTCTEECITDLGTLGGSFAHANAINDSGEAVGCGFIAWDNEADAFSLSLGNGARHFIYARYGARCESYMSMSLLREVT